MNATGRFQLSIVFSFFAFLIFVEGAEARNRQDFYDAANNSSDEMHALKKANKQSIQKTAKGDAGKIAPEMKEDVQIDIGDDSFVAPTTLRGPASFDPVTEDITGIMDYAMEEASKQAARVPKDKPSRK